MADRYPFRVVKGALQPADSVNAKRMVEKHGLRIGDLIYVEIKKPRNPRFHRLAHAFGRLVAENIDSFTGLNAHRVLKRLQWESGIGCDEMGVQINGAHAMVRVPQSLSFDVMDEGEFREVYRGLCRHVAATYWQDLDEDQIAAMAETMVEE